MIYCERQEGGETVGIEMLPAWMSGLEEEDVTFIRNFMLASGSLIQKIRLGEESESEPYISLIKKLALEGRLDLETARLLIGAYKKLDQ